MDEESLSGVDKAERELLRLILANDPAVRHHELGPDLFVRAEHRQAYELVGAAVAALPPGESPDLGAMIGSDESRSAALLRRLALEDRPLGDAVVRLHLGVTASFTQSRDSHR